MQNPGAVKVNVKEGAKLTFEILREGRKWGADDTGKRFLMPALVRDQSKMTLEVAVGKPDRIYFNFSNHIAEFSRGGRKALAEFGANGRDWPSWCNAEGIMVLSPEKMEAFDDEKALNAAGSILGIMGNPADGDFLIKGQFVYSIPLGMNFYEKAWAQADEKFVCYKWTRDGDFANIEITKSKYEPRYGDDDYRKSRTYVNGKARLSLLDGMLVSSDVEIDNGQESVHLISKRL